MHQHSRLSLVEGRDSSGARCDLGVRRGRNGARSCCVFERERGGAERQVTRGFEARVLARCQHFSAIFPAYLARAQLLRIAAQPFTPGRTNGRADEIL